jgi:hypothetical protein
MGMGDGMAMGDGLRIQLQNACDHTQTEQVVITRCKLCGQTVPPNEVNKNGTAEQHGESG